MAEGAKKKVLDSASKKVSAGQRATRPTAKTTRPSARVSEGAEGEFAVLANDPEFQKQVALHIQTGVVARSLVNAITKLIREGAGTTEPAVRHEAAHAAQLFLAAVTEHNGPPPSEEELEAMMRSWA